MIFTIEFIESLCKCKTSKEVSEKLHQAEEVLSDLRNIQYRLEQKEIADLTKGMIQHNKEY